MHLPRIISRHFGINRKSAKSMDIFWSTLTYVILIVREANPVLHEDHNITHQGSDFGFNSTHVLFQTILLCGTDFICNKSLLNIFDIPIQTVSAKARCGSCSCDCFNFTPSINCCPDIFFQHGLLECKDVQILSKTIDRREVVASCPVGTSLNLSQECTRKRSTIDVVLQSPVTSDITNISYLNKNCGACNNATNLKEWNIMFRCSKEVDFNYLSSYQEIVDLATMQACDIRFSPPNSLQSCSMYIHEKISFCNVTGSWQNYDVQIEKACVSSYVAAIGMFKNIFCAMCNPPEFKEGFLIDECDNSTSIYREACRCLPFQEASFPYKNYFCFICNHGDNNTLYYTDVDLVESPSESYVKEGEYPYQFKFTIAYNVDDVNQYINRLLETLNLNETVSKPSTEENMYKTENQFQCSKTIEIGGLGEQTFSTRFNPTPPEDTSTSDANTLSSINITNLIRMSFAFSRHGTCAPGLLPNYTIPLQKQCSCSVGCRSDCCDDFALKVPWTCIDDRYHRDGKKKDFLAIGGCMENQNMEHLCSSEKTHQFYQTFPVTSKHGYRENYVNFFCYLCNRKTNDRNYPNVTENITREIEIWPLVVFCTVYVNHRNFHSLQSLIKYVNQSSCVMEFSPPANSSRCSENCNEGLSEIVEKCNKSKTWSIFNEEILYACENSDSFRFPRIKLDNTIYKNKFCTICNPFKGNIADNYCSDFPLRSNVNQACKEFPSINVCNPYKNVFCEMCHNGGIESYCYEELEANAHSTPIPGPTLPSNPIVGTFRSTFTFSAYDTFDTGIDKSNIKCQQYQIFDGYQNTCKNLTCFPGKLLQNDTCVSLLMEASNLRYTLALKLEFINLALINATVKESITKIRDFISQNINILLNTYVFVEDIILMSRIGCSDVYSKNGEVFLYLKIFINDTVNRDEMEHKLINFTDTHVDWNLSDMLAQVWNGSIMNVKVSRSPQSLFLPSFLWKLDKKTHCFVQAENLSHGPAVFRNVLVNPLLTCKQVIVEDGDFGVVIVEDGDFGVVIVEDGDFGVVIVEDGDFGVVIVEDGDFGVVWTKIGTKYSFLGFSLSSHQFVSSDSGGVRVCAKEIPFYTKTTTLSKNDLSPISILTLVCIIISLICLIITFVTYCMFSSLRTLPGMNNMCLVVSLFLAQLLMIVRPSFRSTWLSIVSALSHFSWLSTFLWLQVCSFHVFRVFSAKGQSEFRGRQSRKIVVQYSIYAYGSSAVIVLTNIVITLIITNGGNTGYDKTSALMTYSVAFIVTLIVPLALVCMTNIVFYIFTAYKIYSTPKIEKTTGSRVHFSVYIKIFTLAGLSWILQILDTFLEMSIFSYLAAILNGLQGLFLMISYVCNGRVWRMYLKACCKTHSDRDISKASSKTDTTKI